MEITSTSRSSKIGMYLLLLLVLACILTIVGLAIAVGVYRNKNRSCGRRESACKEELYICRGNVTTTTMTPGTCPPCDLSTTSGSTTSAFSTTSTTTNSSTGTSSSTVTASIMGNSTPLAQNCPSRDCPAATLSSTVNAGEVLARMDLTADPCDDFYQYACGMYNKPEYRPPDKVVVQTFDLPYEATYQELHTTLSAAGNASFLGSPSTSVQKARDYYLACLTDTADDSRGRQALLQLIADLKSWPLASDFVGTGSWNSSTWNMEDALAASHAIQVDAFMSFGLSVDPANSSNYVITVGPAQLTFKDPQIYRNLSSQQAYKDYVVDVLNLLYGNGNDAKFLDVANTLWSFENSLASIYPNQSELNAALSMNNRKKFGDILSNITGINIINLANKEFQASGVTVTPDTNVLVKTDAYFSSFNSLIAGLGMNSTRVLSTYLVWSAINTFVPYAGETYELAQEKMNVKVFGEMPDSQVRWKACLDDTVNTLGWAAGAAYTQDYVMEADKQNINSILQLSKEELIAEIPAAAWLQDASKPTVQLRANGVMWQTGFPQVIDTAAKLDERYNDITVTSDNHIQNVIAARRFLRLIDVKKYGTGTVSADWDRFPTAVYSYYTPTSNQVLVQAGLLHKPMYSRTFPSSFNYGGIGSILGQKIMMLYGFRESWWDNKTVEEYNKKAQCFIDQYNKESFMGIQVDGRTTAVENIADTEGLRIAYNAYMKHVNNNSEVYDQILPGLNMTGPQQFFLGFTQLGCLNVDPTKVHEVVSSSHVPSPIRVSMLLKNTPEFAQAFNCPANSKMNPDPATRCKL